MLSRINGALVAEVQDTVGFLAFDNLARTVLVWLRRFQRRIDAAKMLGHSHRQLEPLPRVPELDEQHHHCDRQPQE